jgi:fatty-acyl-CoA synthase
MAMPGIRDCKVEAERGPRGLDVVAATLATGRGEAPARTEVVRHCRAHLADYKIPRVIRFVATLAVDVTGKSPKRWAG